MISNKAYDTIKLIALIAIPVLSFLSALCGIWHMQYAAEITATLTAIDTLIGALVTSLKADYDRANQPPED